MLGNSLSLIVGSILGFFIGFSYMQYIVHKEKAALCYALSRFFENIKGQKIETAYKEGANDTADIVKQYTK